MLAMDTDKIKIFGARVKVDGTGKLAELERAEKVRRLATFISNSYLNITIGENEGQSRGHRLAWYHLLREQAAHLQLPRIPAVREGYHVH